MALTRWDGCTWSTATGSTAYAELNDIRGPIEGVEVEI